MGSKKSQLSSFFIIGIIILTIVVVILFTRSELTEMKVAQEEISFGPLQSYIESCIKNVGENAVVHIGNHGGYFELPELSTNQYLAKTAYYFYEDRSVMPSEETIAQEISKYMNEELFFCLRNFVDFQREGLTFIQGNIDTKTIIASNRIIFSVNFPVTARRGFTETKLVSFSNSVDNIRLRTIYNVTKLLVEEQMEDTKTICLSCLINWGIENDLYIDMQRLGNDTVLFTITDFNSEINGKPYRYVFANKYNFTG